MAALNADNEVFVTIALPADIGTRDWRLQCLREAEGVRSVVVEEDRVRCGPFVLGDEAAVPPLLYAFACAAADANEDPVVTFDEAEDCLAFLRAVAQTVGLQRGARHAAHETTDVSCLDEQVLRWVA